MKKKDILLYMEKIKIQYDHNKKIIWYRPFKIIFIITNFFYVAQIIYYSYNKENKYYYIYNTIFCK